MNLILILMNDPSDKEIAKLRNEPKEELRNEIRIGIINNKGIQWAISHLKDLKQDPKLTQFIKLMIDFVIIYVFGSLKMNDKLPRELRQINYNVPINGVDNKISTFIYMYRS